MGYWPGFTATGLTLGLHPARETSFQRNAVSHWLGANIEPTSSRVPRLYVCYKYFLTYLCFLGIFLEVLAWPFTGAEFWRCMGAEEGRALRGIWPAAYICGLFVLEIYTWIIAYTEWLVFFFLNNNLSWIQNFKMTKIPQATFSTPFFMDSNACILIEISLKFVP